MEDNQLPYFFIDSHYAHENKDERAVFHENKEAFWKALNEKPFIKTDMVNIVLTQYGSLQKELEEQKSKIKKQDNRLLHYEKKESARIAKETEDKLKPQEGFTYMQLKIEKHEKNLTNYKSLIEDYCGETNVKPFENRQSFFESLDMISKNKHSNNKFNYNCSPLLLSENLMHNIPQKDKESQVAKLVFLVEINNFTEDLMKGKDLSIQAGARIRRKLKRIQKFCKKKP